MHRVLAITVTGLIFILGAAQSANAGGYVALGMGSEAELTGDFANNFNTDGASNGRFAIGQRTGPIAVEASIFGTDLYGPAGASHSTLAVGVDLKYFVSLSGPIEGYGRAGLNKTWLADDEETTMPSMSGRGYNFGAGLQYSFRLLPLGEVAVWLDYTHQTMNLFEESQSTSRSTLEGAANLMTVGVSVGL